MKLRQQIISILSASVCAVSLCSGAVTVSAETNNDLLQYGDHISYQKIDEDENGTFDYIEISDCNESAKEITIPAEIDGLPVTSIGNGTFQNCTNLKTIDIPDSIITIKNDNTFSSCDSLENINVSPDNENYSSIDGVLFNKTTLIKYPRNKKDIEYSIPDSVTSIGSGAFENCKSLASIKIPDSLTSIEDNAFFNCINLTSVDLPNSIISIGISAFHSCSSLTSIHIPNSVKSIGNNVFYECVNLKSINVAADNEKYTSIDGVLFTKDKTILIKYPTSKTDAEYAIPDSVKLIDNSAFYGCTGLTSVKMGKSTVTIDDNAFFNCKNLVNVEMSDSIKSIGKASFRSCENLTNITIPVSIKSIGSKAFDGCTSLTNTTILNHECNINDSDNTINNGYDENKNYYFNGTIYGYENSTAQKYAIKYGYKFESLGEAPITHIKGDANDDGKVTIKDARFIAKLIAQRKKDELPSWSDFNDDGKITIKDARDIARYIANKPREK